MKNVDNSIYILQISNLLKELWNAEFKAIVSSDFEELLPRRDGYNFEQCQLLN